jgi:hydroxymethylpyrimidine/phosphomethylpyrimidine kinase
MREAKMHKERRPCVLVFAGHDPSGGAGIQADIEAIAAQGAHALPIITALTVQDNNHVYAVHAVSAEVIRAQTLALMTCMPIRAIKLGIVGNRENAEVIAQLIDEMQAQRPADEKCLPVILDPVLGSGRGNALAVDEACLAIAPLLARASLITPNLPELAKLAPHGLTSAQKAASLLGGAVADVLLKGGHADDEAVINRWFSSAHVNEEVQWTWPRLSGQFHGSGCTLAAAIAGRLALGETMEQSLFSGQEYTQAALSCAFAIADGQLIPQRSKIA